MLLLSIAFLFIAPLLNMVSLRKEYVFSSLSGFVFVVVAALIGVDIVPHLIATSGPEIFFLLLMGLILPFVFEKLFHHSNAVHRAISLIGILGLAIHTVADGAALAIYKAGDNLAISVAIHRIPIGLFVWWFIRPYFGSTIAYIMLAVIAGGTILGYTFAEPLINVIHTNGVAYLRAFIVGSLIHVLFHKPPIKISGSSGSLVNQRAEGLGNLMGLICAFYLLTNTTHRTVEANWLTDIGNSFTYLALETSPMLLLAFIFAGLMKAFMPDSFVSWLQYGRPWQQATRGMIVGLPLPLCSCSVLPVYHSLIKKGVPSSAAVAFLIATPELGIDALLISFPLLGADLTIARLVCAALLAFLVAILVSKMLGSRGNSDLAESIEYNRKRTFLEKLGHGMHYSMHELLDHIAPWILAGILMAALIHPILGNLHLDSIPAGWQVLIFATLGIPVYVCASSATPLVAIFLMNGISPGAGLAFLLAGPATNITTFGVLARLHNRSTALVFASGCLAISVILGLTTNFVFPDFRAVNFTYTQHGFTWVHQASLAILVLLFGYTIFRRGMRSFLLESLPHRHTLDTPCSHNH